MPNRAILTAALLLPLCAAPTAAQVRAEPARAAAPSTADIAPAEIVRRASEALNAMGSVTADFTQANPDGRRLTGRIYLSMPGKVRFDYDAPSPLEIIGDGTTLLVRDRKLKTQDQYPISQTPLQFLLDSPVDLSRMKVTGAVMTQIGATVHFDASSGIVGNSRVTLVFDPQVRQLVQWRVLDAQGRTTTVSISNPESSTFTDARLFDVRFQIPQSR